MATAGAAADAPEAGAGAGPSAAETVLTMTAAAAATARILSFRVGAIWLLLEGCCCNELPKITPVVQEN
uniref:Uncharacterized protein n=1 Tax=Triticum urartu TaxID=4572 RepID=A0A8R7K229_TRIUA